MFFDFAIYKKLKWGSLIKCLISILSNLADVTDQLVRSHRRTDLSPPYNLLIKVAMAAFVIVPIGKTKNAKTRKVHKEYFVMLFHEE